MVGFVSIPHATEPIHFLKMICKIYPCI